MFNLANKTALVTGAASGVGAAVAETFAAVGASVWIADRDKTAGQAVAMKIGGRLPVQPSSHRSEPEEDAGITGVLP